jgi:serine/threonine protein kinase
MNLFIFPLIFHSSSADDLPSRMDTGSMLAVPAGAAPSGLPPRLEKFGRYFLLDRIAVGGMAEVYRAVTHGVEGFRRTFVVKRILAEKAASPAFIKMFGEEARISAMLHHQNVVQVYDFGQVHGSYFLAMEFLPGKDLSSLLRVLRAAKAAVPPGIAAYVAREVAMGLHYAHTLRGAGNQPLNIVHRDVTPSNIMLLFAGGVKVLDFGIAKAATEASGDAEGGVKGKFGYLAPEQARNSAEVDGRADVFALGVTLWEMLVGRRLFAGKDDFETLRNVLQKPVPPPSALRPEVPPELDRIVLRALERNRDLRYASADELARDCDKVVREARVDGQTLRGFLNDLFSEESSSLSSLAALDIPEELFQAALSGPVPAPSDSAVPRNGDSLELVIGSAAQGRARTPAPPFGVMAADGDALAAGARWARLRKPAVAACGVAAAAVALLAVVTTWQSRHAARAAVVAPAPVEPSSVTPPTPAPPVAAPEPVIAAPAVPAPPVESEAAKPERPHRRPRSPREGTTRGVSADTTLNPF